MTTFGPRRFAHFAQGEELDAFDSDARHYGQHIMPIDAAHPANCIISGEPDGTFATGMSMHAPVLDDDGGYFRVIPSRTPGHQHVYIEKAIPVAQVRALTPRLGRLRTRRSELG